VRQEYVKGESIITLYKMVNVDPVFQYYRSIKVEEP